MNLREDTKAAWIKYLKTYAPGLTESDITHILVQSGYLFDMILAEVKKSLPKLEIIESSKGYITGKLNGAKLSHNQFLGAEKYQQEFLKGLKKRGLLRK